jgi:hypothetical protein
MDTGNNTDIDTSNNLSKYNNWMQPHVSVSAIDTCWTPDTSSILIVGATQDIITF